MNVGKNVIINALKFYDINDSNYLNNCLECVGYIENNKTFQEKINKVLDTLYNKKNYLLSKLWKIKNNEELFGKSYHPFVTSVIVLLGYKIHKKNIIKYNLDDYQINIHKKRVKEALTYDIYERKYKGIRISQMLWASYFINLKIIEVGSLQYELVNINPLTNKQEKCIKIHIPRDSNLCINSVKLSLNKAKEEILKYYKLKNLNYYCESWLLSNNILKLLNDKSNIKKFSKLFNIVEGKNCINDILNFVYNKLKCDDYNTLQENTFLQKKVKEELIKGVIIKIGIGRLKEDIL